MSASRTQHSWYNVLIVLALCLGSLTFGYAFSIISTTIGQPGFYEFFDLSTEPTSPRYAYTNSILGAMNGLFAAGAFMGCWTMGWMCDTIGRKKALLVAIIISLIGTALQAGSAAVAMFLVARWLTGYGVGNLTPLVPTMQAEISPPGTRGFLVAQNAVFIVAGYVLASWIGVGCYFSSSIAFQWRFPLSVNCLWPLLMLVMWFGIPESPRWLLLKQRPDEAWPIIRKMHPNDSFARREFHQMKVQAEADRVLYESESVWSLFTKPSYRKRMLCGFLVFFSNVSSGAAVIYNYGVLIYHGLGYSGSVPLLLTGAYVTVAALGTLVDSLLVDRIGRKTLLIVGLSGMLVSLICETALDATYVATTNKPGLRAAVFFLFLHITFYTTCVDGSCYVYTSEIFPNHIRARGMAWSTGFAFLLLIPYLEAAPTAFAHVGWRYYILFIVLTSINIIAIYFLFPETKGLALEEVAEKFGDKVEVRLSDIQEVSFDLPTTQESFAEK